MKIISFANQKGGVGKTTSVVTLGEGLARHGFKTLLVDLDPQGHVGFSFGLEKQPGLYRLICAEEPLERVIINARPNLDILPSDKHTEKVKRQITIADFRETVLLDHLRQTTYDVILIDMAPSMDVLHINGLFASDWVIIPTRLDAMAVDGVREILFTMGEIARQGHAFEGYTILPTFFDRITRETLAQIKDLVEAFGARVWPPVPQDTRAREAAAYGKTLWEYAPHCRAITGYRENRQLLGGYAQVLERLIEVIA
ncbi:MAG: ParA family protein [Anaerolineae bacterium]|nr:ParA family protein [Anaerolineae bacterium]